MITSCGKTQLLKGKDRNEGKPLELYQKIGSHAYNGEKKRSKSFVEMEKSSLVVAGSAGVAVVGSWASFFFEP